jgi:hypothetical protein
MVAGLRASFFALVFGALFACADAHDVDAAGGGTVEGPGGDEGETGGGAGASSSTDGRTQTGSPGSDPSAGNDPSSGGSSSGSNSGSSSGSNTGSGSSSGGSSSGGQGNAPTPPPSFPFPGGGGMSGSMSGSGSANVSACSPCSGTMGIAGALEPCCTNDGECGVDLGALTGMSSCVQQNAPGDLDPSCPELDVMGMFTIPGCCMPSGQCGVRIVMLAPLGCVDPDELGGFLGGGGGGGGPTARCRP